MRRIATFTAAALAAAAPVPAQTQTAALCGGQGAEGAWINGTESDSDLAALDAPVDQLAMLPEGRSMVSLFTLGAPATVRLEAAPQAGGDTQIELIDAAGTMIAFDDDGGGGLASRIEVALEPGAYCLVVGGLGGSAVSADVRLGRAEHPALTAGGGGGGGGGATGACLPATPAEPLGDGPVDGALDAGVTATAAIADAPYYRFALGAPAAVTLRAENEAADPVLMLYDDAGRLLAENDDHDGLNARIDMTDPLPAGAYCVALEALSDASQPVTLSLRRYDPAAALLELYARGEASPPPGGPVPIADLGALGGQTVRDVMAGRDAVWFSFTATGGDLALIRAIAIGGGDPELVLFDALGSLVGRNDDTNDSVNAQLATVLGQGTYVVGVRNPYSDAATAVRLSLQRFVPAD
jgi:hypothetical protein